MRKTFSVVMVLLLACVVALSLTGQAFAQEKAKAKAAAPKVDRIAGTVHMIDKDSSTITVRDSRNVMRQIVYSDATKFTKVNKPGGTLDEIKEGTRLICLGKFDEKTRLVAARIDIRLPK
jgi:Cu/Ag efflux protein CusF